MGRLALCDFEKISATGLQAIYRPSRYEFCNRDAKPKGLPKEAVNKINEAHEPVAQLKVGAVTP
jgi:hypothetical protein